MTKMTQGPWTRIRPLQIDGVDAKTAFSNQNGRTYDVHQLRDSIDRLIDVDLVLGEPVGPATALFAPRGPRKWAMSLG